MKRLLAILVAVIIACGCSTADEKQKEGIRKLKSLEWLLGNWEMATGQGTLTESWTKISDTLWMGSGVFVSETGDTAFHEELKIVTRADTLYYIPTVSDQNGGLPVKFKERLIGETEIVFENPAHDFPQIIRYEKTSDTSVHAMVSGNDGGRERKEEFYFIKRR
jgi:hypothetical protein